MATSAVCHCKYRKKENRTSVTLNGTCFARSLCAAVKLPKAKQPNGVPLQDDYEREAKTMTTRLRKTLFVMAAVIILGGAIQPNILFAQTSGVGSDGYTRFMWTGNNFAISIWRLDPSLGGPVSRVYGPYDGWMPRALTVGSNNYTYVLWRNDNGSMSIWSVDPNLNYVTSHAYGPYAGWIPDSISVSQDGANTLRVIWRGTQGEASVWALDTNLKLLTVAAYGPFPSWDSAWQTTSITCADNSGWDY